MAAKPMPSMTMRSPPTTERHVAPGFHTRHDRGIGLRVVVAQEFQRAVGKHDAEAERGVGRILLENGDVGVRIAALEQVGEIKAGRAGAEDGNAHGADFVPRTVTPGAGGRHGLTRSYQSATREPLMSAQWETIMLAFP